MEIQPSLDWSVVQSIVISLALGGLVGLERQSHHEPDEPIESIGVRTFSLASLLGALSVLATPAAPAVPYITGVGYLLLVIAFLFFEYRVFEYRDDQSTLPGITTQVSALIVYVIGALVPSQPVLASAIAVLVASILSIKDWTHRLVENLSEEEVVGTLKFLLISVVLLPILPSEPIDPRGLYNLQELWLLVVLISGISFLGYFAIRFLGRDRGIALTGALGGLASSTAVTLAMSHRADNHPDSRSIHLAAAFAILIASGIMTVRVIVLVFAVSADFASALWIPLVAMAVPGAAASGFLWYRMVHAQEAERGRRATPADEPEMAESGGEALEGGYDDDPEDDLEISNPFELAPALKFGLLFVFIIGGVHLAKQLFGSSGTYVAAFLSGLANMDAISVTIARMSEAGDVTDLVGVRSVVIGIVANSLSKAALSAIIGSRRLGLYVALGLLPTVLVGLAAVFLM